MIWICKCDCGNTKEIMAQSLIRKATLSCGCLNKEIRIKMKTIHGHEQNGKKTPTYVSWEKMMSRCYREKDVGYKYYGAKNIKVCEKWHTFEGFLSDMGERPSRLHSIDRIDCEGNYEPSNCKWSTRKEQANNTRRSKYYEYEGKKRTIAELADIARIKYDTMYYRLEKYKWSVEKSMQPIRVAVEH